MPSSCLRKMTTGQCRNMKCKSPADSCSRYNEALVHATMRPLFTSHSPFVRASFPPCSYRVCGPQSGPPPPLRSSPSSPC